MTSASRLPQCRSVLPMTVFPLCQMYRKYSALISDSQEDPFFFFVFFRLPLLDMGLKTVEHIFLHPQSLTLQKLPKAMKKSLKHRFVTKRTVPVIYITLSWYLSTLYLSLTLLALFSLLDLLEHY